MRKLDSHAAAVYTFPLVNEQSAQAHLPHLDRSTRALRSSQSGAFVGAVQDNASVWHHMSRTMRGDARVCPEALSALTKAALLAPLCTGGQWLIDYGLEVTA